MHDTTALAARMPVSPADKERFTYLRTSFPTAAYLRGGAKRRLPHFAYEYLDGGAGADGGIRRNWDALDAIELVPRYGIAVNLEPLDTMLFGRRYAAPIGFAPTGGQEIAWPGGDEHVARAAQRARVPYWLSNVGGITIEHAAKVAPDVFGFQLYRFPANDHQVGFDLVRRADEAGAHVLILTLDAPVRTVRTRERAAGVSYPIRRKFRIAAGMLASPAYLTAFLTTPQGRYGSLQPYAGSRKVSELAQFIQRELTGGFTWEEVARYRERWNRPLLVKGILHPADAEKAVSLGIDGIVVSNHGGRQIDALPAAIDVLPAIVSAVGGRATILMDSGIRSGLDVARALALGADAAFAGKSVLWSLGALGPEGPSYLIDLLIDELKSSLGQIGARSVAEARLASIRHAAALRFPSASS